MNFADYVRLDIPEGRVKRIARKSDGVILWEAGYVNQVPISIDTDGSVYNGIGYKDGYRVRSGGTEAAMNNCSVTGYIPYKPGDVLRIYPAFTGLNAQNAINFADASFANLGQATASGAAYGICVDANASLWKAAVANVVGDVSVIDISNIPNATAVAYVRVTNLCSGAQMIVTVNEEVS